ncbi:MAG TPA: D-alanyl-D-alanine carboxypeptidase family protein [Azospirillaceae bacterium]|nr:D-alanyl-D-alanine carboxypeptidase family protein [Azospirillaceae bacterium]
MSVAIHLRRALGALVILAAAALPASAAPSIETIAREAVLIDATTGTVLFEKNANARMPTSSMSKVMTMYMVFDRLKAGRLSLDDKLPVSENAWKMQGSKTWVELGNTVRVEDLIRGVIIQSGNDASIVLAEGLAGTEQAFAAAMTKRAHEMGMKDSNFMNSTGWPDENHYSTAHDLAILAQALIKEFPEYYHYYSETEFTYHGIKQGNRNPLLYRNMGVDGLKTGHTEIAGYGLIASGQRNGRRLILVVNGLPNMQARADESARLLEWGFREFDTYAFFKSGDTVDSFPVWLGEQEQVPLVAEGDIKLTLTREQRRNIQVAVVGEAPVPAPIAKGTKLATLRVTGPDIKTVEIPLVAGADVAQLGFGGRIAAAARHFISGTP